MRLFKIMLMLLLAMAFVMPAIAQEDGVAKLTYGENKWVALHYLLQAQGSYEQNTDNAGKNYYGNDAKIRRSRVIIKGQLSEKVNFFMETDAPNQEGDSKSYLFTQDAYIDYAIMDEFKIAAGHILLPFQHHNRASAVSLLGVDYNVKTVPVGGNVWRDTGVEARGLLFGGIIDYRVGAFNGVDRQWVKADQPTAGGAVDDVNDTQLNENDGLRYTGRVQLNFLDAESAFFYSDNYLGKKKVLSIGGGVDYQQDVYAKEAEKTDDYMAWTVDLTVDLPIGTGNSFTLHGAYTQLENSPKYDTDSNWVAVNDDIADSIQATQTYESTMYFVEAGFLWNNMLQPVVKYWTNETTAVKDGDKVKTTMLTGGLNYFINGHNANIKVEYNYPIEDEGHTIDRGVVVQAQIFI